jgi:hypothetical protein
METVRIVQYRDFWDVPRIFLVSFEQSLFLFDCRFSDEVEDYSNKYQVFLMPYLEEQDLIGSWKRLPKKATRSLGEIPVQEVRFDETRRKFIEGEAVLKLLKGAMC